MWLFTDEITIVTFDHPIWLTALDIKKQANLRVNLRLGAFHLLKSCFGHLGIIVDVCGLLPMIHMIYPGSTTANHILNGVRFDFRQSVLISL